MLQTLLTDSTPDIKMEVLALRLTIAYLGEKTQFGWWQTSFFAPASTQFLAPSFPRTTLLAQYHSVTEAARRIHDEFIGLGQVFHLFRLPQEIEHDLHQILLGTSIDTEPTEFLSNKDSAIQQLSRLADDTRSKPSEGPVAIGQVSQILEKPTLKNLAVIYLGAFNCNIKTYPYFLAKS